ncbi:MAG: single-stranded DNA-binding protein [Treponema sp.]|nr:single-stranded DNA-binding protein [Treponema sp.]
MSTDLNSVVLIGRLTRDAELTYLQSGSAVANISIASNRNRKEGDQWISEVNYFDVSLFGKQAESLKQYLLKGKQIAIQGSLKQDRWEKDGQKFSKIRIIANSVELLGGKSEGGGFSSGNGYGGNSFTGSQSYAGNSTGGYQPKGGYGAGQPTYDQSGAADSFGGNNEDFPEEIPF